MKNWLDSIEKRIGHQFRYALENTITLGLRVGCYAVLICSCGLALWWFIGFLCESFWYLLLVLACVPFILVATFGLFWLEED